MSDSILMYLDAEGFSEIVSPFPSGHASAYAEVFLESLNDTDLRILTDLRTSDTDTAIAAAFPDRTPEENSWANFVHTASVNSVMSFSGRSSRSMGSRASQRFLQYFRRGGRAARLRAVLGPDADVGDR